MAYFILVNRNPADVDNADQRLQRLNDPANKAVVDYASLVDSAEERSLYGPGFCGGG